jgi:hypothetical protein
MFSVIYFLPIGESWMSGLRVRGAGEVNIKAAHSLLSLFKPSSRPLLHLSSASQERSGEQAEEREGKNPGWEVCGRVSAAFPLADSMTGERVGNYQH